MCAAFSQQNVFETGCSKGKLVCAAIPVLSSSPLTKQDKFTTPRYPRESSRQLCNTSSASQRHTRHPSYMRGP